MKIAFDWTGTCESCGGPSNRYDFKHRASRSTIRLSGTVRMEKGNLRRFPSDGGRIEVCYRCKCRWLRNKSFTTVVADPAPLREKAIALARTGKLSGVDISRALNVSQQSVSGWLKAAGVSIPTRTPNSAAASRPRRSSRRNGATATTS